MTGTATKPAHRKAPSLPPDPLRLVRRTGYVLLGVQLAAFLAWSSLLWSRYADTFDGAQFVQAWTLIAHGQLDPYDTVHNFMFWQDHSEFGVWPLALLYWLWPHGVTLLWVQDICVVAAEAVAFTWLYELAAKRIPGNGTAWLSALGLLLILVNPWTLTAVSFDFHTESLAVPFAALILRDLWAGRKRAWVWVVPLLLCGDVAGTYLAGIGLGALAASRKFRRQGAAMAALGILAVLVITLVHGNAGSGGGLRTYAYLGGLSPDGQPSMTAIAKGAMLHPGNSVHALWGKRADIWATVAPDGVLGLGFVPVLPSLLAVILADNLAFGFLFSPPSFQYLPIYVLMPAATVAVLAWIAVRRRRLAITLGALVVVQAIGWAVVWLPRVPGTWLRVSPGAAAVLASVQARIPAADEVIASQGIMGPFAGRTDIRPLFGPGSQPVHGTVWVIIAPSQGIEKLSVASAEALTGELAGPLHATLVAHGDGVWAFRWQVPRAITTLQVPQDMSPVPAWVSAGAAGRPVVSGPRDTWHSAATGARGYVTDGLLWRVPAGAYRASVTLASSGPVNVEAWDTNGNVLLARKAVPGSRGVQAVIFPVRAAVAYPVAAYTGWGPFRAEFLPPPPGQRIEIRVWSPGGETVNVYRASLTRVGQ